MGGGGEVRNATSHFMLQKLGISGGPLGLCLHFILSYLRFQDIRIVDTVSDWLIVDLGVVTSKTVLSMLNFTGEVLYGYCTGVG